MVWAKQNSLSDIVDPWPCGRCPNIYNDFVLVLTFSGYFNLGGPRGAATKAAGGCQDKHGKAWSSQCFTVVSTLGIHRKRPKLLVSHKNKKSHWLCSSKCCCKSAPLLKADSGATLLLLGARAKHSGPTRVRVELQDVQGALRAWTRAEPCNAPRDNGIHSATIFSGTIQALPKRRSMEFPFTPSKKGAWHNLVSNFFVLYFLWKCVFLLTPVKNTCYKIAMLVLVVTLIIKWSSPINVKLIFDAFPKECCNIDGRI